MKKFTLTSVLACLLLFTFESCKKDDPVEGASLIVPSNYDGTDFDKNTVNQAEMIANFNTLVQQMKTGQDTTVQLSTSSLRGSWGAIPYTNSPKSNAGWYIQEVESIFIPKLVRHSGRSFNPSNAGNDSFGGVYEARLLDEGGFEILQAIDKGGYASIFLHQILELGKKEINLETIDQMLKLYGAHPDFANTSTSGTVDNPDKFIAAYAARRDKNDGTGIYTQIRMNFLTLQAAVQQGPAFNGEKDHAFDNLVKNMEKAVMATAINYMYAGIDKLSKTNPSDADKAGAIHDLSEALSFIYGFRELNNTHIVITANQVNELLELLEFGGEVNTLYHFVQDPVAYLPQVMQAQEKLKSIYNFSTSQMTDFKSNWVSIQGR